jgi:hypothetical protein
VLPLTCEVLSAIFGPEVCEHHWLMFGGRGFLNRGLNVWYLYFLFHGVLICKSIA